MQTEQLTLSNGKVVTFRLLEEKDSIKEITLLVNQAYKRLLDMGLNYQAATQKEGSTMKRISKAYQCIVGICEDEIIATILLHDYKPNSVCQWYTKSNVAKFGQFAVAPAYQKYGVGSYMLKLVERQAKDMTHIEELALDTSEHAHHLIEYYAKKGYRHVDVIDWDSTNYKSVVMSKCLRGDND